MYLKILHRFCMHEEENNYLKIYTYRAIYNASFIFFLIENILHGFSETSTSPKHKAGIQQRV